MKDKRNWIIVGLVLLSVGLYFHESQPKRPFLKWLGSAIKTALWGAPFVLDEGPQTEPNEERFFVPQYAYGETPIRATGNDGYEVLEHGDNW